ncbi:MAG: hypothetical protein VKL42_05005 [Snowella sp.]|nr:hypothetical protein [Snowella sp.]
MQFDRDKGLDSGRLSLNHLREGHKAIWVATSSTADKQGAEDFNLKGGLIPPQYRCGIPNWTVQTTPIPMPSVKGVEGNFYKIDPYAVKAQPSGTIRGDFGIHRDANVPGSAGCIVMSGDRFKDFESKMRELAKQGIKSIPLFVQYS